ncbi:hypothetical protein FACS189437_00460 [Bacteroidia bacterium]|nr:hypothetical protein FACS189437_00460 [Bacteroidia bacterium]
MFNDSMSDDLGDIGFVLKFRKNRPGGTLVRKTEINNIHTVSNNHKAVYNNEYPFGDILINLVVPEFEWNNL